MGAGGAPTRSDCFRHHHDRAARALLGAEPTTLAEIIVELESVARPELDHGIIGTNAVTVVAREAVAARETPPGLTERLVSSSPCVTSSKVARRRAISSVGRAVFSAS